MAKIAYLSNHFSGAVKLDYLCSKGFKVDTVLTIDEDMATCASVSGYHCFDPLIERYSLKIHFLKSFDMKSEADLEYFKQERFDLLVISGWQRLVPEEILRTLKCGAVAEHGSHEFLPRGRGRSPVGWTLIGGHDRFIIHLFKAGLGADDGPVIDYEIFEISPWDNLRSVYYKASLWSAEMLLRNIDSILSNSTTVKELPVFEPSYFRKRTEADDFIRWSESTRSIFNHIRGSCSPYPCAKGVLGGKAIKISEAYPFDRVTDFETYTLGEIISVFPDNSFLVATSDGRLIVTKYDFDDALKAGLVFQT